MRNVRSILILIMLLVGGSLLLLIFNDFFGDSSASNKPTLFNDAPKLQSNQHGKASAELLSGELYDVMDEHSNEVLRNYGEPIRKDLSAYGYTWWVYTDHQSYYLQFGIKDEQVVTIFATGDGISSGPFTIGMTYEALSEQFTIKDKVTYQSGLSTYSFMLHANDMKMSPLLKISDDLFVQAYFDTFTEELSSIRIITGDLLLVQRFYGMEYRGNLEDEINLSEEQWQAVEKGMEKQILDISNIYRRRHNVLPLIQDESVAEVAFLHSKDMHEKDYFSHDSLDGSSLKDRLGRKEIVYTSGGENIAAHYSDAPAAVEGWLNSEGHREALLNQGYSHLGVGVYRLYYTQNFISK